MLPVLVALTMALAWLLTLGVAHVRAVDAARETARALARDDDRGAAIGLGRQVAPAGAAIETGRDGDTVVVVVRVTIRGPGGLLSGLPGAHVSARAVAAVEESEP